MAKGWGGVVRGLTRFFKVEIKKNPIVKLTTGHHFITNHENAEREGFEPPEV
jgi:hypothetical protein